MTEKYPLPEGWRWVRLGEVCVIVKGKKPDLHDEPINTENLPYLTAEFIRLGTKPKWCLITDNNSVKVNKDEIIIIADGSNSGEVFKGFKGVLASTMGRLKIDEEKVLTDYLFYFIKMNFKELNVPKRGSAIPHLEKDIFYNLSLPLPSLKVQRCIAAKLQALMQEVECARTACDKHLEAAKALPSAYLREVFESEEAKKWERKRLGEVCEYDSGVWGDEPDGSSQCHFVLRSNNIRDGKMVFDEIAIRKVESKYLISKSLKLGDILVTTSSGSKDLLGKSAIFIPPDNKIYLFSNFTMRLRFRPEIIDYFYLFFYLQSPDAKIVLQLLQDTTTGLRNLDRKEFLNQSILLPSLSEQHHIVSHLKEKMAEVEKLCTSIEKQLEAIKALPQAILRKAFRGEV